MSLGLRLEAVRIWSLARVSRTHVECIWEMPERNAEAYVTTWAALADFAEGYEEIAVAFESLHTGIRPSSIPFDPEEHRASSVTLTN